jgi:hypothetical protein
MSTQYLTCESCSMFPAITRVNAAPAWLNSYDPKYVCRLCANRIANDRDEYLRTPYKIEPLRCKCNKTCTTFSVTIPQ